MRATYLLPRKMSFSVVNILFVWFALITAARGFSIMDVPKGPIVSLPTPFDHNSGNVDLAALGKHLDFIAEAGINAVLCNGMEGERFSVTHEERLGISSVCRSCFPGLVLCDASEYNGISVYENIKRATMFADAIVVSPPPLHVDASAKGVHAYLSSAILAAQGTPILLHVSWFCVNSY